MAELKIEIRYPYGAFYDVSRPGSMATSTAIIVYTDLRNVTREISSLEGYFLSEKPLETENLVCVRDQMDDFAKKHSGRFERLSDILLGLV